MARFPGATVRECAQCHVYYLYGDYREDVLLLRGIVKPHGIRWDVRQHRCWFAIRCSIERVKLPWLRWDFEKKDIEHYMVLL
jgi:hypothetical protein